MSPSNADKRPLAGAACVANCHLHKAQDRYGDDAENACLLRMRRDFQGGFATDFPDEVEWPLDDHPGASIYHEMPDVQLWRNNLTALSHSHPLYFGAFQGRIFVYEMSTAMTDGRLIQQFPNLQLVPPPSAVGRERPGVIRPDRGHIINHIVTGFLGDREVVAAAFDNGDVLAYAVPEIVSEMESRATTAAGPEQPRHPQPHADTVPFFHENVYDSAWGLAVHEKSRLIAVSSNRREITVFAFPAGQQAPARTCEGCRGGVEELVRRRARLWRIVVAFGPKCHNIPNIAFVDDSEGEAQAVCGMNIEGVAWIAPIWAKHDKVYAICNRSRVPKHLPLSHRGDWPWLRGWGVIPLPVEAFMVVDDPRDLLGGPVDHVGSVLDAFQFVLDIPDNPCLEDLMTYLRHWGHTMLMRIERLPEPSAAELELRDALATALEEEDHVLLLEKWRPPPQGSEDASDADGDAEDGGLLEDLWDASEMGHDEHETDSVGTEEAVDDATAAQSDGGESPGGSRRKSSCCGADYTASEDPPTWPPMVYIPSEGRIATTVYHPDTGPQRLGRDLAVETNKLPRSLWKRYKFLTTYSDSLALLAPAPEGGGGGGDSAPTQVEVNFAKAVGPYMHLHPLTPEGWLFHRDMRRLNMLAVVPELSLLAIGSSTGRVLIVTPTRMARRDASGGGSVGGGSGLEFGFRVEAILPKAADEEMYRTRPVPLHGIAVGPMRYGVEEKRATAKRYLLTMHYRNHDILTYELGRCAQDERIVIF